MAVTSLRRKVLLYSLATLLPLATAALLVVLFPSPPIGFVLLAVLTCSYCGRLGPGLLALAVASVAAGLIDYTAGSGDVMRVASVVTMGAAMVAVIEGLHRSRARERGSRFAAEASHQRFSALFFGSPVALALSRLDDHTVVEVNDAYERLFGAWRADLVGRAPGSAGIHIDGDVRAALYARLAAGHEIIEHEVDVTGPSGTVTVMLWSRTLELEGTRYVLTTFLDITEHKHAEREAQRSNELLHDFTTSVPEIFWLADTHDLRCLYVSPAYETIFGRSAKALLADARDWAAAVHPDDRARARQFAEEMKTLDGRREIEFRIFDRERTVRTLHTSVFPVHVERGGATQIAGITEDITHELGLEDQLRQAQKLESLGLLASGVAHDFNNVLAVIGANTSLLHDAVPPSHRDHELVTEIEGAVSRAVGLTHQLLAFSRKQVVEPVVLDLNAAIKDTRKMLRRMVGEDVVIETSLEPELQHVRIDPGYLVQVLMNLAVNARDAMPRGGTLSITTRNMERACGPQVVLSVADTGCGMSADVCARVFEPFFTTKGVGKGTGLGLSVVHGIVEQAGGHIELESEPGAGASFRIYLPAIDAPLDEVGDVAVAGAHGSEKVMIVDDDLYVRRSISRALRSRGYTVIEAGHARNALRLLEEHGDDIALLVTDVVMPGMDGRELVTAARSRRPSLKVLYMSGYTDDAVLRHGVSTAEVALIEKPFPTHALAGKVRQLIDA